MKKPRWRRRASTFLVDSPHLRLRVDELELPDGTIVPDYYVRESDGFVVVFPLTADDRIVMVRQYRYGSDAIHLELPAGGLHAGEDPRECAARELLEETGYEATGWEFAGSYYAEPVRATAQARIFLATGARKTREPQPDTTEVLEVELATFDEFRSMLSDGRIDAGHVLVAGYRVLDILGRL
ncbi:MAG TPA: NUDIX hydrolase [Candidatus Tumulicola sp.]|jgi:8-oxo-dGTP pyrophosphatase MutT (NUDIX family)